MECKAIIQSWGSTDVTVRENTAQRGFLKNQAILVIEDGASGSRHTL